MLVSDSVGPSSAPPDVAPAFHPTLRGAASSIPPGATGHSHRIAGNPIILIRDAWTSASAFSRHPLSPFRSTHTALTTIRTHLSVVATILRTSLLVLKSSSA